MNETIEIATEQINDLPLLLGIVEEMGVRRLIDAQIRPHGRWQGISVGTVVSIWLCHLLMERDQRLVAVRDWAAARRQTLDDLLGVRLRDTDLTDDRPANVLTMLSAPADQEAVDQALPADWLRVYALPQRTVRLDGTSVRAYQDARPPEGPIRHGVSKGHRPDLAQVKVMLASLDPLGLPLACQAVPGNRSDDLPYIPAYDAAMGALGTTAVLVVGDNKMAALARRAHIVRGGSAYLCA
jgi:transposase